MTDDQMRELLDKIIATKHHENTFFYEEPIKPTPGPPATASELNRLDSYLAAQNLEAPKAYKQFLSIYNGIEDILGRRYSLLPISAVVGKEYKLLPENKEEFPQYCEFVIAAGNTPNFIGFDTSSSPAKGGYRVVEVSADGSEWKLKNFEDFLNKLLGVLEKSVKAQEKDREKLRP